jgi:nitrous oxidase accessory protein NosD
VRGRTVAAMVAVAALVGGGAALAATQFIEASGEPEAYGVNEIARNGNVQGVLYPGDPTSEAELVEQEGQRVVYVRKVASAAYWALSVDEPYRFQTGDRYTLVLPERPEPYTVDDLLALAPESLTSNADGSYLLTEDIAVMEGATLALGSVALRLQSSAAGFTSIVAFGGRLEIAGTPEAPASITSWDSAAGAPDTDTRDGRAYLRVIGGTADLSHAALSALGFWSGSTGGLAITGSDDLDDPTLAGTMQPGARALVAPPGAPVVDAAAAIDDADAADAAASSAPAGLASATIADSAMTGNAFGIFVSGAQNVKITRTTVSGSLVDGITFHRAVSASLVEDSQSMDNAVDGVTIGRSTSGITLQNVMAARNGRNGVSMDGQSLADGPSASGTTVESFGDNILDGGHVAENGRYGVEIMGGSGIQVTQTRFVRNPDGVVLDRGAAGVRVTGNEFVDQAAKSIAVRESVTDAVVEGNTITGSDTGVNVRNADADITGNVVHDVSNHAVLLVGDVTGTTVAGNDLGGDGSTALRAEGSRGAVIGENDTDRWHPAATVTSVLRFIFQPLTVIWLGLGVLLLVTAATRKDRHFGTFRHPYEQHVPLTSLSRGIVSPDSLRDGPS